MQGLILVTAGFENRARGKEAGFKRQLAHGLHKLRENRDAARRVGLPDLNGWIDEVTHVYLEACKELDWQRWREKSGRAPPLPSDRG